MILKVPFSELSKWDKRGMEQARLAASWSKDPSTKVGAYISSGKRPVSHGYNGFPPRLDDSPEIYLDRERKYMRTLHAELNAILNARAPVDGSTLYSTHAPCPQCMGAIIASGVGSIVAPSPYDNEDYISRWGTQVAEAERMANEAGIVLLYFTEG